MNIGLEYTCPVHRCAHCPIFLKFNGSCQRVFSSKTCHFNSLANYITGGYDYVWTDGQW